MVIDHGIFRIKLHTLLQFGYGTQITSFQVVDPTQSIHDGRVVGHLLFWRVDVRLVYQDISHYGFAGKK